METIVCQCCGKLIIRKITDKQSAWNRRKYCNYSCSITKRNTDKDEFPNDPISRCKVLLRRTKKNNYGCLEWEGAKNKAGYGEALICGRHWKAHRAIYHYLVASIPENMNVCHKCDNPSCINPEHLFLGTQSDNVMDMVYKERNRNGNKLMMTKNIKTQLLKKLGEGVPKPLVAIEFGISLQTVYNVINRV